MLWLRLIALFALWLVLIGTSPGDLAVGALAAALAGAASVRLLPPRGRRLRFAALGAIALRLLAQSIAAGADVARRALHPRLPLKPGFVALQLRLAAGPARDAFCALTSLLPGTVPAGTDARGVLQVHCLDVDQPVAAQLADDEARFARALGEDGDG